ncbi:MAG: branched-chain amino acid ABC transporter permease [Trueperaceae bacterium]|nr:branched-chain amino acid ABC transporter permease [Trueperaceae bacterium]
MYHTEKGVTTLAVSSVSRAKRKVNWLPWLLLLGIAVIIIGRIIYLYSLDPRFNTAFFLRAFIESVKLGSLYALIALGYTMVYGIIRLINFAHGEVFMVGAFMTYFFFTFTPYPWFISAIYAAIIAYGSMRVLEFFRGSMRDPLVLAAGGVIFIGLTVLVSSITFPFWLALICSMIFTGVLGIVIDRVAYFPLRTAPRNSLLITAIAVSFLLQNLGLLVFTNRQTPFRPDTPLIQPLQLTVGNGQVFSNWLLLAIPLITAILVVVLTLFVNRTRLGKAMRASAQDAETAQMMGVSVNKVIATTFLLGSMLAAAGGAMWGLNFGSLNQPAILGILPGIKAFSAAVIGGIGSLPGAVIGAIIIGFLENFTTAIFPKTATFQGVTEFKDTFAFILLIIVLLVRPSGIVGEDLSEKV